MNANKELLAAAEYASQFLTVQRSVEELKTIKKRLDAAIKAIKAQS
jgi:hypothetical protein